MPSPSDVSSGPRSFGNARRLRITMFLGGLAAIILTESGRACHLIGGALTVLALALYWVEAPRFVRLVTMWCAGFVLILTYEGVTDAELITRLYGHAAFDTASRCLVASHLAVLLGHDLVFHEQRVQAPRMQALLSSRVLMPLLVIGWVVTMAYMIPIAITVYSTGRVGLENELGAPSVGGALAQGIGTSTGILIPIAAVWTARHSRATRRLLLLVMAATIVVFMFTLGSRFPLLFVMVGGGVAWLAPRPPRGAIMLVLAALVVLLAFVGSVMSGSRTYGMRNADLGRSASEFSVDDFFMSEDSVRSMTQAVVFAERHGYTNGRTSAALLVFWVPRALWADKPTMIGYWLPREFERQGFGAGFSSAPSFAGSTYVDFGLWSSVVLWFLFGLTFGGLEIWCARICASVQDARMIVVAPLYGGSFFAVRSIETSALVLAGVLLTAVAILTLSGRWHRSATPRVTATDAALPAPR